MTRPPMHNWNLEHHKDRCAVAGVFEAAAPTLSGSGGQHE